MPPSLTPCVPLVPTELMRDLFESGRNTIFDNFTESITARQISRQYSYAIFMAWKRSAGDGDSQTHGRTQMDVALAFGSIICKTGGVRASLLAWSGQPAQERRTKATLAAIGSGGSKFDKCSRTGQSELRFN